MTETRTPALASAYAFCRSVARQEAKNFYWAFRVLPPHKSDAMCAVYAFMRKADDLADDESLSLEARRHAMAEWTDLWRASRHQQQADPVFLALNDTQQRFGISNDLLEKLVAGTTMDLDATPAGTCLLTPNDGRNRTFQVYESQAALEDYCYLVASVVGLVCIRIFGYQDARAEALAIDTGKAFQLTNILRDVKEDADRGRVYLPAALLDEFGVTLSRLLELTQGAAPNIAELAMLHAFGARAETLYGSADELVPLLDRDAQPAMRVLATIYHRLLHRASRPEGINLRQRVSVPTGEKLAVLARGLAESVLARFGA